MVLAAALAAQPARRRSAPGGQSGRLQSRPMEPPIERVWDYPRPPALVPCTRRVRIELGGVTVADSTRALRVLETSHPPTIYVPPQDVDPACVRAARGRSFCEFKGTASYLDVLGGSEVRERAAWTYPEPTRG